MVCPKSVGVQSGSRTHDDRFCRPTPYHLAIWTQELKQLGALTGVAPASPWLRTTATYLIVHKAMWDKPTGMTGFEPATFR